MRGYANLGLLTEFQWDAASAAYKALALLYAQRLVASQPESAQAFWHRAYAEVLASIPWLANDDIDEDEVRRRNCLRPSGRRRPAGGAGRRLVPLRVRPARSGEPRAGRRAGGTPAPAYPRAATAKRMSPCAARAVIDANPERFRAYDALCEVSGVANPHLATTLAPEVLSKNVPHLIAAIPGLPEAARKAAERLDEVAMTRAR